MINSENKELTITHDNEVAYVLSKFGQDFIYNTVTEALGMRLSYYDIGRPNLVRGYETMFRQILLDYPDSKEEILATRTETYTNILKILCDYYQLQYEDYDTYDLYTSVAYMYDLLVTGFQSSIYTFFFNFIIKEKDSLYESLNLAERKKNKDIGNAYAKQVFSDPKLGAICTNLEFVIKSILCMDISFDQYVEFAFQGHNDYPKSAQVLTTVLKPQVNFKDTYITPVLNGEYATIIISSVNFMLRKTISVRSEDPINGTEPDSAE